MPTPVLVNTRSPVVVQASRMSRIENRLTDLDRQIATGEKFAEPADDPSAANRSAVLVRMRANLDSTRGSLDRATTRLSLAENGIASASAVLVRARDLALGAANGASGQEARSVILKEVEILRQQLMDTANMQDDGGRYIFGGADNGKPPFTANAQGRIEWQGFGSGAGGEAAGMGAISVPAGAQLFGDDTTGAFAILDNLMAALKEPDADIAGGALSGAVSALDGANSRLLLSRAGIGAGMARIEAETSRIERMKLDLEAELGKVAGVDLTAAISEMQALKLNQSAAQLSFTAIFDGTLFDRLG